MPTSGRMGRRAALWLLGALVVVALAALPVAPTSAATTPPEVVPIPPASTGEVLGAIPLEDLNESELAKLLAQRPGLELLPEGPVRSAVEEVLATLAGKGVTLEQLGESNELLPKLEEALTNLLSSGELTSLLKGETLQEALTKALGSVEPEKLVKELLDGSSHPEEVLTQALSGVSPETLESTVGSVLAGEPFSKTTVGELASSSGTTEEALTQAVGQNSEQLPPTAMALTAPLTNGKALAVLNGVEGLDLATLPGEAANGGLGGSGGKGGNGGNGSPGGGASAGSGTPSTTVIITGGTPAPAGPTGSAAAVGKVKVLSHKVHGKTATLVVQVPSAGTLGLSGKGVKKVSRQTAKSERVTIKTSLTKAGTASRRRHRHLAVKLSVTFKPVSGAASAASATAHFG